MQTVSNNVVASPSRIHLYSTHQPSHHTRILRLLFSGLQAAAPWVIAASFPAAVSPWYWWWWWPFLIILSDDEFISLKKQVQEPLPRDSLRTRRCVESKCARFPCRTAGLCDSSSYSRNSTAMRQYLLWRPGDAATHDACYVKVAVESRRVSKEEPTVHKTPRNAPLRMGILFWKGPAWRRAFLTVDLTQVESYDKVPVQSRHVIA